MAGLGDLVANLTVNTRGWTTGLAGAGSSLGNFASGVGSKLAMVGLAAQGASAILTGLGHVASAGVGMVKLAADAEQVGISFEVMLGSGEKANTLLGQMRQFASTTPLDTASLQEAGKTLLQFGTDGGQVMPILRMLGDVSGGNAEKMKSLALVFGQMSATGRLMGQDLLQFINQGFNPLQEISKHTGESMASLKKKMEDGAISSDMVAASFQRATSEGGQFHGMLQKQGQSTAGLWGQLQDGVSLAMTDIGNAIIEGFDLKGLMGEGDSFLSYFRSNFLPGVKSGIETIGAVFQKLSGPYINALIEGFNMVSRVSATAGQAMNENFGSTFTAITDWLVSFYDTMAFAFKNFETLIAIAVENVGLFASNSLEYISTFFTNFGELLTWFGTNFSDIFTTAADLVLTIFINLGENLRAIWDGVLDYISGNGFDVDLKPLTEGFHNSISKMPEFTEAAIAETTPTLEALYAQLADTQKASAEESIAEIAAIPEEALKIGTAATDTTADKDKKKATGNTLALEGSSEAFKSIYANMNRGPAKDSQAQIARTVDEQLKEQRKTNERLEKLAGESWVVFGGTV